MDRQMQRIMLSKMWSVNDRVPLNGRYLWVVIALILYAAPMAAQTQRQYLKAADEAFQRHNYREAVIYYDTVFSIRPEDPEIAWKFAEAARLYKIYARSEPAYANVLASEKGRKDFPLAGFWLGIVRKSQGKYESAINALDSFLQVGAASSEVYRENAQREIENCRWALSISEDDFPKRVITHLDTMVNTAFSEIAPFWTGQELYYASLRFPNPEDTYIPSRPITKILRYDSLTPGVALGDTINFRNRHSANLTINRAGTRLYFTGCDYTEGLSIQCMIYQRDLQEDGTWGPPVLLNDAVNAPQTNTSNPSVGYDEVLQQEVLYFASDRLGGKGGMDIWYAPLDEEGSPGPAINFERVNTPADEITPFYDETFRILYFSSQNHQNMGGFDIFELKQTGPGEWGTVQNLGLPVNTSYDETHFSVDQTGDFAHYASNHPDQVVHEPENRDLRTCCSDIYSAFLNRFILLEASAVCEDQPLGAALFHLEQLDGRVSPMTAQADTLREKLLPESDFRLIAAIPEYHPDTVLFSTRDMQGGEVAFVVAHPKARAFLTVSLTDKINDEPILGATVKILDDRGDILFTESGLTSHSVTVEVEPLRDYDIVVQAPRYLASTRTVSIPTSCTPQKIDAGFAMTPLNLELPLRLFFDNDRPDPGTLRTTTRRSYDQVYRNYYSRKGTFIGEYTRGMDSDSLAEKATAEIDSFFEADVKHGYNRLEAFADELIPYLEKLEDGQTLIISIRGFASPVADGLYNQNLTKRRIASVRNFFNRKYGGDRLQEFIDQKKLLVIEKSFGESEAGEDVSDDPNDDRNAVYSVKASRERRVEIIDIARQEEGQ